MSGPVTTAPDAAADARWLAWTARGAERERRSAVTMTWLFTSVMVVAVGWLAVQAL